MRVVIDINILVSALIVPTGQPAAVIRMWLDGKFTLLTCATHVNELRATLHKPRIAELIEPVDLAEPGESAGAGPTRAEPNGPGATSPLGRSTARAARRRGGASSGLPGSEPGTTTE